MQVRLPVERLASFENFLEFAHRFKAARHRAKVTLIDDTLHVFLGRGTNPDGD